MSKYSQEIFKSHHPKKHYNSFSYAISGIRHALVNESSFRLQILIAASVLILGFFYHLTFVEWSLLILTIGFVTVCELINTLVEDIMDFLSPAYSVEVKIIKDLSAGFVFISAAVSVVVGLLIFAPKIF